MWMEGEEIESQTDNDRLDNPTPIWLVTHSQVFSLYVRHNCHGMWVYFVSSKNTPARTEHVSTLIESNDGIDELCSKQAAEISKVWNVFVTCQPEKSTLNICSMTLH